MRGEDKLLFAGVVEGDEAPEVRHRLTRADLVEYAGASGDFNPMHTDEVAAREAGQKSVFGHGMFTAGLLATAITDWVGIGNLTRYHVRFVKQTWPGEELVTKIVVVAKRDGYDGRFLDLECRVANAEGEVKVAGEATASLAS